MQENEYKTLYDLEDYYWWYVGRRKIIFNVLSTVLSESPRLTIDFGCGTGSNLKLLQQLGGKVIGVDVAPQAIEYCKKRNLSDTFLIKSPADLKSFSGQGADLITLLDVLEHIDNDGETLAKIKQNLSPQGLLLLTVPAYQFLWSGHDIALHHKRRYTLGSLKRVLERTGFKIEKATYAISFMFPIIAFYRLANKLVPQTDISDPASSHVILPPKLNRLMIRFLYVEAWLCKRLRIPFGTSAIIAARNRPENQEL